MLKDQPPKRNYWRRPTLPPNLYWLTLAISLSEGYDEAAMYAFWYVTLQRAWPQHFERERPLYPLAWLDKEIEERGSE